MSTLADRVAHATVCVRCGGPLAVDQDWCLECGTAVNSPILPAGDWRVPLAIVGGVIAVVAGAFVFLLVSLSNSADRSAAAAAVAAAPVAPAQPAASATTRAPAATTSVSTAPATTTAPTAAFASWPSGVSAFTVILTDVPSKAVATASAAKLAAAGIPVGMLYSSDFSSLRPGDWIVFSGTYGARAQADAAAAQLQAKGQTIAYSFRVVPAG